MTDKRIPKPGEVWTLKGTGVTSEVINVYPDCLTYWHSVYRKATTINDFLDRYTPPEPVVVESMHVMHDDIGFWMADRPEDWNVAPIGTIAAMSDGTFRFEAAS